MREAVRDWVGVKVDAETKVRVVGFWDWLRRFLGTYWGFERGVARRGRVVKPFMIVYFWRTS